jgi:2-polyprenyl-3-methyl-5-hydroxy-6-metoxy-1,4-benzoquinol methylase
MEFIDQPEFSNLARLVRELGATWPAHNRALLKSFEKRTSDDLRFADQLAGMVLRLSTSIPGGLTELVEDYRFLCERIILPEEIHFRRTGQYRLTTFRQALTEVYNDQPFMTRYMNGLLLSSVLWVNHARALMHYGQRFLPVVPGGSRLLEIGPGHGLLLCMAGRKADLQLTGWDVSGASLAATRAATELLGVENPIRFEQRDIFDAADLGSEAGQFGAIVMSEVLEHLEDPRTALDVLFRLAKPGGLVWLNVPVNSPAPDHIFLLSHPQEASDLVSGAGFEIVEAAEFAMNDVEMNRAIEKKLTVSCAIIARKPAN